MIYKGAIFDLDGTLVDSIEDLADSMNLVLMDNNLPGHDLQEYKYFVGNGIRNLVLRALPEQSDVDLVKKCYDSMIETYTDNCVRKSKPYAGIIDLLCELQARKMKVAVLSNKADNLTKKIIRILFPENIFTEVNGLKEEAMKKPDPGGALQIARNMGIIPEKIIYFGDTGIDMETANRAGMYAIGVLWGFRGRDELIASGAKLLIEFPSDIIKYL